MTHQPDLLQNHSEPTKPPSVRSTASTPTTTSANRPWNAQLSTLIRQSFDVFNVYGKSEEAIENITIGFKIALDGMDMVDISIGFKEWLKTQSSFPTPADIKKLAEHSRTIRAQAVGRRVQRNWLQVIRRHDTDEILAEFQHPRESLSQVEIGERWPGIRVRISYTQE